MNDSTAAATSPPIPRPDTRLLNAGFLSLLGTQFLGAVNDNAFRWLVIGVGKQYVGQDSAAAILMAGTVCFVVPYLLLAAPAGYLADRFSKRRVIVWCKVAEIMIMILGMAAIISGQLWLLFVVVGLMGAQSALFSPSKSGTIPEILPEQQISNANGLFGLATVIATVIGTGIGNVLSDVTRPRGQANWWITLAVLGGVAAAGWLVSLRVTRVASADPARRFPWGAPQQTWRDLRMLGSNLALMRVALGIAFFWSLGTLTNLNIDQFAFAGGAEFQWQIVPLLMSLVSGIGLGSVLAGRWSGGRIELGILPLGAMGLSLSSLLLFTARGALFNPSLSPNLVYIWSCVLLVCLGFSAGLFHVPLQAYMQHHSPRKQRGSLLAASNFVTFVGILLASIAFWVLRHPWQGESLLRPRSIFLACGLLTLPVLVYILWLVPQAFLRFIFWLLSHTLYRLRVFGEQNIPREGGALIVPNHISWIDGVLIMLNGKRPVRMFVWAGNFRSPVMMWLASLFGTILVSSGPKSIIRALKEAHDAIENGDLVGIFPEGGISRSGQVQAFKPGMLRILKGIEAPVIPVYLDELWGSIFSFKGGKFFTKMPRQIPYPVSIHYGKPILDVKNVHQVRQAVMELGSDAVQKRNQHFMPLAPTIVKMCKRRLFASKIADSSGADMTGGEVLMRALILRRLLRRGVLRDGEEKVGVLLPPSCGGVLANLALLLDRRCGVNLNYTVTSDVLSECLAVAGIQRVLTSRRFMSKMDFDLNTDLVYLEDFKDKVTLGDKVAGATGAYLTPASMLAKSLGLDKNKGDDDVTVIFTSGSTGTPKGVVLTYDNVASNIEAIDQTVRLTSKDVVIGILPFFHSFGYTVTLWTILALDIKGVYHYSPIDGKRVGKLAEQHGATVLLSTPTFLRNYLRRCTPEQFAKLDVVVAGAEKLPVALCDAFEEKFGTRPVEGYGCTELSPLAAVNVPPSRSSAVGQIDRKEGSVGRAVPGVTAKVVDLDTGEELGTDQEGMLMIKGPNVMKCYLNEPEKTAEVVKDGWYVTGDMALIDAEGFIQITGRQSRFSKIGGEMVPHIKIEEALNEMLGGEEELKAAVTAVPDERKGERLVVLHTKIDKTPTKLIEALQATGLPNLYIPSKDSFLELPELPLLGTGKLDLHRLKELALAELGK